MSRLSLVVNFGLIFQIDIVMNLSFLCCYVFQAGIFLIAELSAHIYNVCLLLGCESSMGIPELRLV